MSEISKTIGHRIRVYRKNRNLSLDELSAIICKSKSTLSKYENGEISIDIETLYELADALNIHIDQLIFERKPDQETRPLNYEGGLFKDLGQFYSYIFDGRNNRIMESTFDVLKGEDGKLSKVMMYMNYKDFSSYQNCETTYFGHIEQFDALTNILLTNMYSPIEKASAQILASYLNLDRKWGLWNGLSSRPMMPIAGKMLFSKERLKMDDELKQDLKINKEDIRLLKLYNMFPVI